MNDNIIWLLIGAFAVLIGYIGKMQSDITRINKKINWIAKQLGESDTITDDLKQLLSEGKKVEAIKKYRIASGTGLLEAKEYVESLNEKE
ncbi:Ribosomal protein L7/L12 C-terminal domain [Desulfonispora thiosulfatigenes DSM 11270]|uniref:Ribosomal protein L7/L12 C-terminal domain n=1 Tax=Desulfonispora thiosulfatigenes DSM 11270 TaxID=656914 RepID=A0A1W1UWM4_DESTI|nr:50S ribosomal protein L7/L12 [Desulfonispora thiosulfatigenes]SMB85191.1 Ribosomal protein L7/L12 C-terminal domain [Desulfonispora thiosulfatigenes DSM 11270]